MFVEKKKVYRIVSRGCTGTSWPLIGQIRKPESCQSESYSPASGALSEHLRGRPLQRLGRSGDGGGNTGKDAWVAPELEIWRTRSFSQMCF